ncbi:hypothetical protein AB8880_11345 [Alphaproteobacteria bacterium LSUCC0684]
MEIGERRLIRHLAARRCRKTICWKLGCDRSTSWYKWKIALAKIVLRSNALEHACWWIMYHPC